MKRLLSTLAIGGIIFGATAIAAKDGAAVFEARCRSCHAADGSGNPAISKMMKVTLQPLGSPEVQAKTDSELKSILTSGVGKMKPVAGLAGADADSVVAYLRTLKK